MVKIINKKNITDSDSLKNRINFNKKYSKYDFDEWINKHYKFNNSQNILDIGCGDGKQINFAIKKSKKKSLVVGVDLSKKSLEKINSKYNKNKKVKLINTSMDNTKGIESYIKNKKFDLIHSTYALYYSKEPFKLIRYLKRKLKKNSRLIITIPGEINSLKKILKIRDDKKNISKDEIEKFMIKNFDVVQINYLNNYLKVDKIKDMINFYVSSGIYDKKKFKFFKNYVKKKIEQVGYFKINKSSIMLIGYN